jgi:hypothetical protein
LDGKYAKQYTAPIHQDKWILDQNKNGIIAWLPLNEERIFSTDFRSKKD